MSVSGRSCGDVCGSSKNPPFGVTRYDGSPRIGPQSLSRRPIKNDVNRSDLPAADKEGKGITVLLCDPRFALPARLAVHVAKPRALLQHFNKSSAKRALPAGPCVGTPLQRLCDYL